MRLILILCPYTKGYVPCSPLLCTFILGSFFIQDKQNKEIWSFFFLMFLPLIDFTVWGFERNHLEDGTSLQIIFRSQGLHSQWSPSTKKRRKGTYKASLIIEFKWFLFLYSLNIPNQVLLITRVLGSFLSGSVPDLPLEQRCVEVVQHVEGRRGETARNDSNPHPISHNPGNFPYPLRERRRKKSFSLFLIIFLPVKHQGIKPNCSVIFREHGKGPFLFLKQKGLETPSFP